MNRISLISIWVLLFGLQISVYADNMTFKFVPDDQQKNITIIIAEFIDQNGSTIGKSLSYLLWNELSKSIGYRQGIRVEFLSALEEKRIGELETGRHRLALEIIKDFSASMILWGEVKATRKNEDTKIEVKNFLTINPDNLISDLSLELIIEAQRKLYPFYAKLPQSHLSFERFQLEFNDLYARQLLTRTPVVLHAKPNMTSPVVNRVPDGFVLNSRDIHGSWFEVDLPEGKIGYIEANQVSVISEYREIEPRNISFQKKYDDKNQTDSQRSLVATQLRFTLPVVHFIAGISYYHTQHFEDAYWEFSQFINNSEVYENNFNLAIAYQWQGASLILATSSNIDETIVLEPFSNAYSQTPNHPGVYNLRALARLGASGQLSGVLEDLRQALALDPQNRSTRRFLHRLSQIDRSGAIDLPALDWLETLETIVGVEDIRGTCPEELIEDALKSKDGKELNARDDCPVFLSEADLNSITNKPGDDVSVKIVNRTDYMLNLYFVGAIIRSIGVLPHRSEEIKLTEGNFELAMKLSQSPGGQQSQIRPLYGTQYYAKNTQYEMNFYIDWQGGR